jgi:hypothetical protein
MSPVTHLLSGWLLSSAVKLKRRDRLLITAAAIIPDIDGIGIVADFLKGSPVDRLEWWGTYHHVLGHNLLFVFAVTLLGFFLSTRRRVTALLVFVSLHIHLAEDVLGSQGPDGDHWAVPYLMPFSDAWQWTWSGQWPLASWQNFVITAAMLAFAFSLAWKRGRSPLELISRKADAAFVHALRRRFGDPPGA